MRKGNIQSSIFVGIPIAHVKSRVEIDCYEALDPPFRQSVEHGTSFHPTEHVKREGSSHFCGLRQIAAERKAQVK
jgi:hypothetical protein